MKITIVCPCCIWKEEPDEVGDQILKAIVPLNNELFLNLHGNGTVSIDTSFTCKRCGCGFQIDIEDGRWGIADHEPQCGKGRRMNAAEEEAFQKALKPKEDGPK